MKKIYFFRNGNTLVYAGQKDSDQIPELQESWILLYLEFLVSKGYDPEEFKFMFPDGKEGRFFKLDDESYNWEIT